MKNGMWLDLRFFGGDYKRELGVTHQVLGSASCKSVDRVPDLQVKSTFDDLQSRPFDSKNQLST